MLSIVSAKTFCFARLVFEACKDVWLELYIKSKVLGRRLTRDSVTLSRSSERSKWD